MIHACVKVHVCKMLTCNPLVQKKIWGVWTEQNYWFRTFVCRNETWTFHTCVLHFYCVLNRNINNIIRTEGTNTVKSLNLRQEVMGSGGTSCSEWMYLKDKWTPDKCFIDPLPSLDERFPYFSSQTPLDLNNLSFDVYIILNKMKLN